MFTKLSSVAPAAAFLAANPAHGQAAAQPARDYGFGVNGLASSGFAATNEHWNDVRLRPDGQFVVAGSTGAPSLGGPGRLFVALYLPSGLLDNSFNGKGTATPPRSRAGKSTLRGSNRPSADIGRRKFVDAKQPFP